MKQPKVNLANKYQFSSLLKNPFSWMPFLYDLYRHEKIVEAISFLIWELSHILKIFKESDYLIFKEANLHSKDKNIFECFQDLSGILFLDDRIEIEEILDGWKNIFIHIDKINGKKVYYQSLLSDSRRLYKQDLSISESPCFMALFDDEITCIFVSSKNTVFVCTKGSVYHSNDEGKSFQESLKLSNPNSYILPFTGVTETPFNTIIIGEYGSVWDKQRGRWLKLPYLYYTSTEGEIWKRIDFLLKKGINKHVHIIRYCKFLNKLILTDGDNKKKLWVSDPILSDNLEKIKWKLFNRFHFEMGGAYINRRK